ncbi:MAG: HD domain-containing phosphohydrolase [Gammaproteobacteria bacterium]
MSAVAAISDASADGRSVTPCKDRDASQLIDLFDAMNQAVLERAPNGSFLFKNTPAEWFRILSKEAEITDGRIELEGHSSYLDHFLSDATQWWSEGGAGWLHSGTWLEADAVGKDWPFAARAISRHGNAMLIIECVAEDYEAQVQLLQAAREHLLNEELLEREVHRRTAAIRQREEEIAIRLLAAAGMRDEETGSHVRRIGLFSATLAEALGWDAARTADIRVAAPMHDIGKIGIPDAVLLKPGRLTQDEFAIMKQHTVIGAKMLGDSDIPLLVMSREIALGHHERWDGSGYPQGLRGEEIPLTARIVALVDVYDAMLHRRVYKAPIAEAEVIATMTAASGAHFDPALFKVFLRILPALRRITASVQE